MWRHSPRSRGPKECFFPLRVSLLSNTTSIFNTCCWFENGPFWLTPFLKTPAPYRPAPALLAGAKMGRFGAPPSQYLISSQPNTTHLLMVQSRAVLQHLFLKNPCNKRPTLLAGAKTGHFGAPTSQNSMKISACT